MQNTEHSVSHPFAGLSWQHWFMLVIAGGVIAILSLGVHDVMLTKLDIPFPVTDTVPPWARAIDAWVRIGALACFCYFARQSLLSMSSVRAAIMIGVLLVMLNETLRVFIVDIYLTKGWLDGRWLFTVVNCIPGTATLLFYGAVATIIGYRLMPTRGGLAVMASMIVGIFGVYLLRPLLHSSAMQIEHAFNLTEPAELYQLPYSFQVYRVIYGTFIEPTVAAFIMVALVWPGLPSGVLRKTCAFVVLILLVRGRVVAELLFSFWVPEHRNIAFLSESQFFLETFVLCLLVALVWGGLRRSAPSMTRAD